MRIRTRRLGKTKIHQNYKVPRVSSQTWASWRGQKLWSISYVPLFASTDGKWSAEKGVREQRIQGLYNQVETLWHRLEMDQDAIDLFVESNRGSGDATIQAVSGR